MTPRGGADLLPFLVIGDFRISFGECLFLVSGCRDDLCDCSLLYDSLQ